MPKNKDKVINRTLWPLIKMSTADGIKCHSQMEYCPQGHEMETCTMPDSGDEGRYCKQCGDFTFQPNQNRFGDQCRMRRTCDKYKMKFAKYGDRISDAECECELGYHFENEDQRACVPNKVCPKGYGQTIFGICEKCIENGMWSDTVDSVGRCKPLRNCRKENRCTIQESNGEFDNKCGSIVQDVNNCDSIVTHSNGLSSDAPSTGMIIGICLGALALLFILIILIVCFVRRRHTNRKLGRLTTEEMDEMLQEIIKRSRKDELYCRKVLTIAQKEVEDRINNQIWALPQELFRKHIEPAKYEVMLEKYKEKQHKFAINGYLQDWRSWRGDTSEAVEELVTCLQSDKVKREDIVYEIVMKLNEDFPQVYAGGGAHNRSSNQGPVKRFCSVLFPCACHEDQYDNCESKETSSKLLETQVVNEKDPSPHEFMSPPPDYQAPPPDGGSLTPTDAGAIYRVGPVPSAPVIDDDEEDKVEVKGTHFYDRSDSVPVQCSS